MKVNCQRDISFKSIYTNRTFKKGLEFAADNGALFGATATLALSMFARPVAIWLAPNTTKENKKVACAKSISSSVVGFLLMLGVSLPIANSIKKIDKKPQKYLKNETINNLKDEGQALVKSKPYELATQLFKLGSAALVAVPKAFLTAVGLPIIMEHVFNKKNEEGQNKNISFKGKGERVTHTIASVIDKKGLQKFSNKYKDSNFPMHIVAATDILNTGAFIYYTKESKKIEERRKKALIYNTAIATGLSILSGYIVDKLLDKPAQKFIENFKKANKGQANLEKQVEGIKIIKPMLILGIIYYTFIPFVSTYMAELADKNPKFDLEKRG